MIRLKQIIAEQSLPRWSYGDPGKLISGDKNGTGVLQWREAKYDGQLKDGQPSGKGTLQFAEYTYKGTFVPRGLQGALYGIGEWKDNEGNSYRGFFENNTFQGTGIFKNKHGIEFKGMFRDDKWNDYTLEQLVSIKSEEQRKSVIGSNDPVDTSNKGLPDWDSGKPGKLIKGDKNGKGVVEWSDAKYYGELRNGIPNGQGSIARTKSDGSKWYYKGSFKAGKKDGYGVQTWSDGASYKGSYKAGRYDGYGVFTWSSGDLYKGSWKAGERDGYGVYMRSDGSSYKGNWKADEPDGYGVYTSTAGLKFCGNWVKTQLDGKRPGDFDSMTSSPYRCNKKPVDFTYTDPENPITMGPTDEWEYYFNETEQQWYTRRKGNTDWIKMVAKLPDTQMQKALDILNKYVDSHKKLPVQPVKLKKGDKVKFKAGVGENLTLYKYNNTGFYNAGTYVVEQNANVVYLGQDTTGEYVLVQFLGEPGKPKYWIKKKFLL